MNRKQWRVVVTGAIAGVAAAAVPLGGVSVPLSATHTNPPGGGVYYMSTSLEIRPRACVLTLVLAATAGLVFALRGPKAGEQDA